MTYITSWRRRERVRDVLFASQNHELGHHCLYRYFVCDVGGWLVRDTVFARGVSNVGMLIASTAGPQLFCDVYFRARYKNVLQVLQQ